MMSHPSIRAEAVLGMLLLALAACSDVAENANDAGNGTTLGGSSGAAGSTAAGALGGVAGTSGAGTSGAALGGAAGSGGATSNGGAAGSSGASLRASYATVREMVDLVCGNASCHGGEHELFMRDDEKLYGTLTTHVSMGCGNRLLVKPGFPQESAFWLVLGAECGSVPRMPNGCIPAEGTCIPQDYVDGVEQWIESGAPDH